MSELNEMRTVKYRIFALFVLAVAGFGVRASDIDVSVEARDGQRQLDKAWQLGGFMLSDPDIVARPWTRYLTVGGNKEAFLKLDYDEQFRLLSMQYEDLAALMATNRNTMCSSFFEQPPAHRVVTWASRRFAMTIAMYLSGVNEIDDWVSRALKIQRHRKAELRLFMKESVHFSQVFDKLCFDSDLTVGEVGEMMALSPEATADPKWELDREFLAQWKREMGF